MGIGANPTNIGQLVGYKQKALLKRAQTYLTPQPTPAQWLQYGVTAVGYHGLQRTKTIHRPRQFT
jgi:hypothetical protein